MEEVVFLLATIAIELPVAILVLRKEDWRRVFFIGLSVNMITHPIAWQFVLRGFHWGAVEVAVAVFEMSVFVYFFSAYRRTAAVAALLMNGVSASVGVIFF